MLLRVVLATHPHEVDIVSQTSNPWGILRTELKIIDCFLVPFLIEGLSIDVLTAVPA